MFNNLYRVDDVVELFSLTELRFVIFRAVDNHLQIFDGKFNFYYFRNIKIAARPLKRV